VTGKGVVGVRGDKEVVKRKRNEGSG